MKKALMVDCLLLCIVFIWGATFVVVQNAVHMLPPNTFNAIRFFSASLFLSLIYFIRNPRAWQTCNFSLVRSGVFLGFWLFVSYAAQTVGLLYTSPSKAGFITGLSVVLVPLLSIVVLKHKVKASAFIGVCMAVIGLYLLTMNGTLSLTFGDFLVLCCAICFAMQIVLTGRYSPRFPTMPLVIIQLFTVSFFSMCYALLLEDWQAIYDPFIIGHPEVLWALFITAIPATALAFLVQTSFQKDTSPTHVALIFALEPVFAAFTSYLWIHELLTMKQLIGCAFILSGMLFSELPILFWLRNLKAKISA